jgi:ABC-type multidrug transport system fused ATPase/permease subunit
MTSLQGNIKFENVDFGYVENELVLKGLNFNSIWPNGYTGATGRKVHDY